MAYPMVMGSAPPGCRLARPAVSLQFREHLFVVLTEFRRAAGDRPRACLQSDGRAGVQDVTVEILVEHRDLEAA